ncbi:MAG TPA: prepilin-type N-terminal cleavage/methylation domain-containing protein [Candidatus Methylomirabilis sp.]|nr:prepilin-type N-terminal cleavage/methylation domain-containing protein [Candidatus Methylomirabilis sp.]
MLKQPRRGASGFTLVELFVVVAIIGILTAIAVPNLLSAQKKARYSRAASSTKTAVAQGMIYSNDNKANPGNMKALRDGGYANIPDTDPWGRNWSYSPAFADTSSPAVIGEFGVCSNGPMKAAICPSWPLTDIPQSVTDGPVGYSSLYGAFGSVLTQNVYYSNPSQAAIPDNRP